MHALVGIFPMCSAVGPTTPTVTSWSSESGRDRARGSWPGSAAAAVVAVTAEDSVEREGRSVARAIRGHLSEDKYIGGLCAHAHALSCCPVARNLRSISSRPSLPASSHFARFNGQPRRYDSTPRKQATCFDRRTASHRWHALPDPHAGFHGLGEATPWRPRPPVG